jgi:hypothetical protein
MSQYLPLRDQKQRTGSPKRSLPPLAVPATSKHWAATASARVAMTPSSPTLWCGGHGHPAVG